MKFGMIFTIIGLVFTILGITVTKDVKMLSIAFIFVGFIFATLGLIKIIKTIKKQ